METEHKHSAIAHTVEQIYRQANRQTKDKRTDWQRYRTKIFDFFVCFDSAPQHSLPAKSIIMPTDLTSLLVFLLCVRQAMICPALEEGWGAEGNVHCSAIAKLVYNFLSGIETITGNHFRQTITTGFHLAVFKLFKTSENKLVFRETFWKTRRGSTVQLERY